MGNIVKRATAGAALGGSLFFTAGLAIAFAQPETANDDLVNLSLGSAGTLEDVNVTSAVQIAAAVCSGVAVPEQQVTTSADSVDASRHRSGRLHQQPGRNHNQPERPGPVRGGTGGRRGNPHEPHNHHDYHDHDRKPAKLRLNRPHRPCPDAGGEALSVSFGYRLSGGAGADVVHWPLDDHL